MSSSPALTRTIGKTERALQALLQSRLSVSGLSFPDWTVMVFLAGGPLDKSMLAGRLSEGRIVQPVEVPALIDGLVEAGLLIQDGDAIALSAAGRTVFNEVHTRVGEATREVLDGISADDMDATTRTLAHLAGKAEALLARAS